MSVAVWMVWTVALAAGTQEPAVPAPEPVTEEAPVDAPEPEPEPEPEAEPEADAPDAPEADAPAEPEGADAAEAEAPPSLPMRRGRPVPPGTPAAYRTQKPTPPYARWPQSSDEVFDSIDACREHFEETVPKAGRSSIRRFDVVWRRCTPTMEGWRYLESHAPLTLDPVLDPILLIVPPAIVAGQLARNPDPAARGLDNWALQCDGTDCARRYDGWTGPTKPLGAWRTFSDVMLATSWALTLAPLATSSGNAKLTDTVIMVEVAVVNASISQGLSLRSGEPRPAAFSDLRQWDTEDLWDNQRGLRGRDAFLSNVSGHTSTVASTFFGLATLQAAYTGRGKPLKVALPYVFAAGFTALQGVARVQSLQADPVDVTLGALTGTAVGILVPLAHIGIAKVVDPVRLKERRDAKRSQVTVQPTVGPNSVGLTGSF